VAFLSLSGPRFLLLAVGHGVVNAHIGVAWAEGTGGHSGLKCRHLVSASGSATERELHLPVALVQEGVRQGACGGPEAGPCSSKGPYYGGLYI
jgi:hypothetical protein